MDIQSIIKVVAPLCVVFAILSLPMAFLWLDYRTRKRGLDTLRIYAERGEEPPASVIEAVTKTTNPWGNPSHPKPSALQKRGNHLAHAAANTVIAIGLAGLVWWRVSAYGEKGTAIVVGILAVLFFAGGAAARMVYAYYAPEK